MKRLIVVLALFSSVACSVASPGPGQEAVVVDYPIIFGNGGIRENPVKTGMEYFAFSSKVLTVNMAPDQIDVNFDDLMSKDGVPLDFHAGVQIQINDSVKLVKMGYTDLRTAFAKTVQYDFMMAVRDAVKNRGMNEMAITSVAADEVDKEVTEAMTKIIAKANVPFTLRGVTLGKANPPDAIKTQRIETAAQEQRQNTERQAKLAEDERFKHEQSRAAADNAYRENMHLSPEQFVQLKQIEAIKEVCAWQRGNCTFVGTPNNLLLNIK